MGEAPSCCITMICSSVEFTGRHSLSTTSDLLAIYKTQAVLYAKADNFFASARLNRVQLGSWG